VSQRPRVIAFYLPQFHPIPENDAWWGKGFTEWTNVARAKPLFWGHKQPKIPADLGFYDLRVSETREAQARMARDAGIEGFCYWHYWFGNGKQLLERPFNEVLESGKPDFPFCLAWANESWKAKIWSTDAKKDRVLIEQKYEGLDDYTNHFYALLPAFRDRRYIHVNDKLLFMILNPAAFADCHVFIDLWRRLAKKEGLPGFHFVAHRENTCKDLALYLNTGFDAVYTNNIFNALKGVQKNAFTFAKNIFYKALHIPRIVNFTEIIKQSYSLEDKNERYYPGLLCGWDHTPRSGRNGYVVVNFTARSFRRHIQDIFSLLDGKPSEHKIVFLKSWNEWAEGNFMEPDLRDKDMKLRVLRSVIENNG